MRHVTIVIGFAISIVDPISSYIIYAFDAVCLVLQGTRPLQVCFFEGGSAKVQKLESKSYTFWKNILPHSHEGDS